MRIIEIINENTFLRREKITEEFLKCPRQNIEISRHILVR